MTEDYRVDGNAAAGALREVFALDVTAARGQCAGCGATATIAEARAYTRAPGVVLRCVSCEGVLVRLVSGGGRRWLDLRGLTWLQLAE